MNPMIQLCLAMEIRDQQSVYSVTKMNREEYKENGSLNAS